MSTLTGREAIESCDAPRWGKMWYARHVGADMHHAPGIWTCPFCHAQGTCIHSKKLTTFGVAWLIVTLFVTCGLLAPFAWLFREGRGYCANCRSKVY